MDNKDFMVVEHTITQDIPVGHADVDLEIVNQRFIVGPAIFEREPAILDFLKTMERVGVTKSDVALKQVNYSASSGIFSETTQCSYTARLRSSLVRLKNVLKALEGIKDCQILGLKWGYEQVEEISEILVERTILETKGKAQKRARLLGSTIAGLHRLECGVEKGSEALIPHNMRSESNSMKSKVSKTSSLLRGRWGSTMTLIAKVRAEFLVEYVPEID
jgi:hypothetical protein